MCMPSRVEAPKTKPAPPPQAPAATVQIDSPYAADNTAVADFNGNAARRRQGFKSLRIERTGSVGVSN